MKGSGGSEGGLVLFGVGFLLSVAALYFFFDSVIATSDVGLFSGLMRGRRGHGGGHGGMGGGLTTSMGIIFVPFLIGTIGLFYDASKQWAWWMMYLGVGVICVEILSHLRFNMNMKVSHLLGMMVMFAAGAGLMLRSYRDYGQAIREWESENISGGGRDVAQKRNPAADRDVDA